MVALVAIGLRAPLAGRLAIGVIQVLDRINAPELRVRRMLELLLEHRFVRPGDDDPLGPLT